MKRKPLKNSIRFEVFKRDSFTCQYRGRNAPNTILEIDHIEPVKLGGTNELTNLITSCFECNRGKSAKKLDDQSTVAKQHKQLAELEERRQQIEAIFNWKKELEGLDEIKSAMVIDYIEAKIPGNELGDSARTIIQDICGRFETAEILEAIDISQRTYLKLGKGSANFEAGSISTFLDKISGIIINRRKPKHEQKISYIRSICRSSFGYFDPKKASALLEKFRLGLVEQGISEDRILEQFDQLSEFSRGAKNWTEWREHIEGLNQNYSPDPDEIFEPDPDFDFEIAVDGFLSNQPHVLTALDRILSAYDEYDKQIFTEKFHEWHLDLFFHILNELEAGGGDFTSPEFDFSKFYGRNAHRHLFANFQITNDEQFILNDSPRVLLENCALNFGLDEILTNSFLSHNGKLLVVDLIESYGVKFGKN